jgi:hypothetical protein
VNVLGSAAIGIAGRGGAAGQARLLLVTGFLGGFTTFSAFAGSGGALGEVAGARYAGIGRPRPSSARRAVRSVPPAAMVGAPVRRVGHEHLARW